MYNRRPMWCSALVDSTSILYLCAPSVSREKFCLIAPPPTRKFEVLFFCTIKINRIIKHYIQRNSIQRITKIYKWNYGHYMSYYPVLLKVWLIDSYSQQLSRNKVNRKLIKVSITTGSTVHQIIGSGTCRTLSKSLTNRNASGPSWSCMADRHGVAHFFVRDVTRRRSSQNP